MPVNVLCPTLNYTLFFELTQILHEPDANHSKNKQKLLDEPLYALRAAQNT